MPDSTSRPSCYSPRKVKRHKPFYSHAVNPGKALVPTVGRRSMLMGAEVSVNFATVGADDTGPSGQGGQCGYGSDHQRCHGSGPTLVGAGEAGVTAPSMISVHQCCKGLGSGQYKTGASSPDGGTGLEAAEVFIRALSFGTMSYGYGIRASPARYRPGPPMQRCTSRAAVDARPALPPTAGSVMRCVRRASPHSRVSGYREEPGARASARGDRFRARRTGGRREGQVASTSRIRR